MTALRLAVIAALAMVSSGLAAGCSKRREAPRDDRPTPISAEERARTIDACRAHADQICACATRLPDRLDLAELCQTDRALPGALELVLQTHDNREATRNDVILAKNQVKKLGASCFERIAKLPGLGCDAAPHPAGPGAGDPPPPPP